MFLEGIGTHRKTDNTHIIVVVAYFVFFKNKRKRLTVHFCTTKIFYIHRQYLKSRVCQCHRKCVVLKLYIVMCTRDTKQCRIRRMYNGRRYTHVCAFTENVYYYLKAQRYTHRINNVVVVARATHV